MTVFSKPLKAAGRFFKGCVCGRHASDEEHLAAQGTAPGESLYRRVIETAVLKTIFRMMRSAALPQGGRRLDGGGGRFERSAHRRGTDAFARAGAIEKKDLKVGFIPSPARRPSSWRIRLAFSKHGHERGSRESCRLGGDPGQDLNKEYDAGTCWRPCRSPSPSASAPTHPYTMPAVENINGQASPSR